MSDRSRDIEQVDHSTLVCTVCGKNLPLTDSNIETPTSQPSNFSTLAYYIHMQRYHPEYLRVQIKFWFIGALLVASGIALIFFVAQFDYPLAFAIPFVLLIGSCLLVFRIYRDKVRFGKKGLSLEHPRRDAYLENDYWHTPAYRWEINKCHICGESVAITGNLKQNLRAHNQLTHPEYYESTGRLMKPTIICMSAFMVILFASFLFRSQTLILLDMLVFVPAIGTFITLGFKNERKYSGIKQAKESRGGGRKD